MTDPLLTIDDATREFRVSPKTVRRRLAAGEIEGAYKRPGSRGPEWVMPRASLVAAGFVERGGVEPVAEVPGDDRGRAAYWERRALDAEAALAATRGASTPGPAVEGSPRRRRLSGPALVAGAVLVALLAAVLVLGAGGDGEWRRPSGPAEAARQVLSGLTAPGEAVGVIGEVPGDAIPPERRAVEIGAGEDDGPRYVVAAVGGDGPAAGDELVPGSTAVLRLPHDGGWLVVVDSAPDAAAATAGTPEASAAPTAPTTARPAAPATPSTTTPPPPPPRPSADDPAAAGVPGSGAPDAPSPSSPDGTVVVQAGDSFWSLATDLAAVDGRASVADITQVWAALIDRNADRLVEPGNPDLLHVGQTLLLPTS